MRSARTKIAVAVLIGWLVAACGAAPTVSPSGVAAPTATTSAPPSDDIEEAPSPSLRRAQRTLRQPAWPTSTTWSSA